MSWADVGNAVKNYAPLVGMALTSPVGAVAAVGSVVANIFGTKASPEDVLKFIETDPTRAAERLQHEIATNIDFQNLCLKGKQEDNRHEEQMAAIVSADTASARGNSQNVNQSPVDNRIKMMLVGSDVLFLGICIAGIFYLNGKIDQGTSMILGSIIGYLCASLKDKGGFYWGSSFGSKAKDDFIMKPK